MDESLARAKLLAWQTRREHSRKELMRKLRELECPPALAEKLLDDLAAAGYQSDVRYAEMFVNRRQRQGYGPLRIRQELQLAGITADLQEEVLDDAHRDWAQTAAQLARKKFGRQAPADFRDKARRARFLYGKGFSGAQMAACLGGEAPDDADLMD